MAISRDFEPKSSLPGSRSADDGPSADVEAASQKTALRDLNQEVDRLRVVVTEMWKLLSAEVGVTAAQLEERLRMRLDYQRQAAHHPGVCQGCAVSVSPDVRYCIFCSAGSAGSSKNGQQGF